MKDKKENKPEKTPFFEFYFHPLLKSLFSPVIGVKNAVLRHLGYWECDGCRELHSPRVMKFLYYEGTNKYIMCSLYSNKERRAKAFSKFKK